MPLPEFQPFVASRMADCGNPSSSVSIGAQFLEKVYDATEDLIDDGEKGEDALTDMGHGIADSIVGNLSTHNLWNAFVDLEAYKIDIEDFCSSDLDLKKSNLYRIPQAALYQIAEALIYMLLQKYALTQVCPSCDGAGTHHGFGDRDLPCNPCKAKGRMSREDLDMNWFE